MECSDLTVSNGNVTVTGINSRDIANYTCKEGNTLEGNATIEFLLDGVWSGDEPLCLRESDKPTYFA